MSTPIFNQIRENAADSNDKHFTGSTRYYSCCVTLHYQNHFIMFDTNNISLVSSKRVVVAVAVQKRTRKTENRGDKERDAIGMELRTFVYSKQCLLHVIKRSTHMSLMVSQFLDSLDIITCLTTATTGEMHDLYSCRCVSMRLPFSM